MTFKEWWKVHYLSTGTTVKDTAEQAYKAGADSHYPTADAYEAVCTALHRKENELKMSFTAEQVRAAISNTLCTHKFLHDLTILGIEKLCNAVCAKLAKEQYTTRPNTVLGGTDILLDSELIATLSPKCKVTPEEFVARVKEGTR